MAVLQPPSAGLAALLPELRRRVTLTQVALSEALGCSVPTVQRLEAGERSATLRRLFKLADVLGTTATALACLIEGARECGEERTALVAWLDGLVWEDGVRPRLRGEAGVTAPTPMLRDRDPEGRRRSRVFGRLIPVLSRRAGLTRTDLAAEWGPSPSTIKRFSAGGTSPDLDELAELGRLLGLGWAEIVALCEVAASAVPLESIKAKQNPKEMERVGVWVTDEVRWIANPGVGLLASRPAGIRFELLEVGAAEAVEEAAGGAGLELASSGDGPTNEDDPPAGGQLGSARSASTRPGYQEAVVEPAAGKLLAALDQGWSALSARIVPQVGAAGDGAGAIAAQLARLLAREGGGMRDVVLLRSARRGAVQPARGVAAQAALFRDRDDERVETIAARAALRRVAERAAMGDPYRLVVADGLGALRASGLAGRQPSPALMGAALVVIDADLTRPPKDLRQITGRPLDWEMPWIQAMEAGLVAGLRFVGVADPAAKSTDRDYLRWKDEPRRERNEREWLDDARLSALAAAGAFRRGADTVVITRSASEVEWVEDWVARHRGSRSGLSVVHGSNKRGSWGDSLDELVLLDKSYPRMLVRQIARALPLADLTRGLNVWELESGFDPNASKRRGNLAGTLGVPVTEMRESAGRWASGGGACSFRWVAPAKEKAGG
jgi:transcriptional regulator with XRE-family HTH domain